MFREMFSDFVFLSDLIDAGSGEFLFGRCGPQILNERLGHGRRFRARDDRGFIIGVALDVRWELSDEFDPFSSYGFTSESKQNPISFPLPVASRSMV
jgi:hypothetical protein